MSLYARQAGPHEDHPVRFLNLSEYIARGSKSEILIAVGSEEARLRASLRPPLKLHVRFSRMQLSRRLSDAGMREKELS